MDDKLFESMDAFYLGKEKDLGSLAMLPSKWLLTHGVIVGMTGSGKTGLGTVLLEEAAIDGIPSIAIDPKGDLSNLLLTFPNLDAASFAPWISSNEDPELVATNAREGLAASGQDGSRIARFESSVSRKVYTPGSSIGTPLSLFPSLAVPSDAHAFADSAIAVTNALFALCGVEVDAAADPAHAFLAQIVMQGWQENRTHTLTSLLTQIVSPPFQNLGALDVEMVFPKAKRLALAVRLNTALASPARSSMFQGESLDVQSLLFEGDGKPKLSILSIAHLDDAARMTFVTTLLEQLIVWMRKQSGTGSLRAILYMDEIFGFFPPVANPPSKQPMLTLLKQARAFGLGVVLATQNPMDLDYKGLSNAGTWMIGRLPTERDQLRVKEGLESALEGQVNAKEAISNLPTLLSGLPKRSFVLHSVHAPKLSVFETRYALSFLKGPLSAEEMKRLARANPGMSTGSTTVAAGMSTGSTTVTSTTILAPGIEIKFIAVASPNSLPVNYFPGFAAKVRVRYADKKAACDEYREHLLLAPLEGPDGDEEPGFDKGFWADAARVTVSDAKPFEGQEQNLPVSASREKNWATWSKDAASHVVQMRTFSLWTCSALKMFSQAGESQTDFVNRVHATFRENKEEAMRKLRAKYEPKVQRLEAKVAKAQGKVEAEKRDRSATWASDGLSVGASVFSILTGGRGITTAVRGAASAAKRASKNSSDAEKVSLDLQQATEERDALLEELQSAVDELNGSFDVQQIRVEPYLVRAKKSDVDVREVFLAWVC